VVTRAVVALVLAAAVAQAQGVPPRASGVTAQSLSEQLLGGYFSMNSLVLTESNPARTALAIMGGRVYLYSTTNAYFFFDPAIGVVFASQIKNAPGGNLLTDYLMSAQQDRPVAFSESRGFRHVCAAALVGTCGAGTITEGTTQCLSATVTSRTRYCTCTSNGAGSPVYAWALEGGAGAVGDATTCPEVTP
jgi:hypothetical protein